MSEQITALREELRDLAELISATEARASQAEDPFAWDLSIQGLEARRSHLRSQIERELEVAQVAELSVELDGAPVQGQTIDLDFVSRFLGQVQKVVASLGQALERRPTRRGLIPEPITDRTALRLAPVQGGSFRMLLVGSTQPNLLGESLIEDSFAELHRLLDAGDDAEALAGLLAQLGPRVQSHYDRFLDCIAGNSAEVAIRSRARIGEEREAVIDHGQAHAIRQTLQLLEREEEREVTLWGRLIGLLQHKQDFEFRDLAAAELITGKVISDALPDAIRHYDQELQATFTVDTVTIAGTDEVKESWTLVSIQGNAGTEHLQEPAQE